MQAVDGRDGIDALWDASVRFEKIIWLPAATSGSAASEDLSEFVEGDFPQPGDSLFQQLPALAQFENDDDAPNVDDAVEALLDARAHGFLVQVARPVMAYHGDGATFSWGHYRTKWVYAEQFEDVITRALDWAAVMDTHDKARAA